MIVTPALVPNPPLHAYVVPPVAVRLIVGAKQVSNVVPLLLVMPTAGTEVLAVMVTADVAVQPLLPVAVTV